MGFLGGSQLQPVENAYHRKFEEREEAREVIKGQRT